MPILPPGKPGLEAGSRRYWYFFPLGKPHQLPDHARPCQLGGAAPAAPARARLGADRRHLAARPDSRLGDHARQRDLGLRDYGRRAVRRLALAGPLRLRPDGHPAPPRGRPAGLAISLQVPVAAGVSAAPRRPYGASLARWT